MQEWLGDQFYDDLDYNANFVIVKVPKLETSFDAFSFNFKVHSQV